MRSLETDMKPYTAAERPACQKHLMVFIEVLTDCQALIMQRRISKDDVPQVVRGVFRGIKTVDTLSLSATLEDLQTALERHLCQEQHINELISWLKMPRRRDGEYWEQYMLRIMTHWVRLSAVIPATVMLEALCNKCLPIHVWKDEHVTLVAQVRERRKEFFTFTFVMKLATEFECFKTLSAIPVENRLPRVSDVPKGAEPRAKPHEDTRRRRVVEGKGTKEKAESETKKSSKKSEYEEVRSCYACEKQGHIVTKCPDKDKKKAYLQKMKAKRDRPKSEDKGSKEKKEDNSQKKKQKNEGSEE